MLYLLKFRFHLPTAIVAVLLGNVHVLQAQGIHRQKLLIGYNYAEERSLYANVITFPERIEYAHFDAEQMLLSALLRGFNRWRFPKRRGRLMVYGVEDQSLRWQKKMKFHKSNVFQSSHFFLENKGAFTKASSLVDGSALWDAPHEPFFVHDDGRISVGYATAGGRRINNELEAIDLHTGKRLWRRKVPLSGGWSQLETLDDSSYLVLAGGIHRFDVYTGQGWSYSSSTTYMQYSNLMSNVLEIEGDYFLSTRSNLVRIGAENGKVRWKSEFPELWAGTSYLFGDDSLVYMLHKGLADTPQGSAPYGEAFIGAFRKSSGHPQYLQPLHNPEMPVIDQEEQGGFLLLLRPGQIEAYAKQDGQRTGFKAYKDDYEGMPIEFLHAPEVYTKLPDGSFKSLYAQDSVHTFALLSSGLIAALDSSLERRYELVVDALWLHVAKIGTFDLICDGERTLILDKWGQMHAELKAQEGRIFQERYLVFHQAEQCFILDLKPILRSKS